MGWLAWTDKVVQIQMSGRIRVDVELRAGLAVYRVRETCWCFCRFCCLCCFWGRGRLRALRALRFVCVGGFFVSLLFFLSFVPPFLFFLSPSGCLSVVFVLFLCGLAISFVCVFPAYSAECISSFLSFSCLLFVCERSLQSWRFCSTETASAARTSARKT